jgi:hypothetical protein
MPIDEALEQLKDVPEHILNKRFPETVDELARIYKDKFKIYTSAKGFFINVEPLDVYKDIFNKGYFKLRYSFQLKSLTKSPLRDRGARMFLEAQNGITWQNIEKDPRGNFYDYTVSGRKLNVVTKSDKELTENWYRKTEEFILNNIPELEEFVKNYDAN